MFRRPALVVALVLATLSITPAASSAAGFASFSLEDAFRAGGSPPIPAAWAGVWAAADSIHACGNPTITGTDADFDTLCTGAPVIDESGGLSCSGTADDVSANVVCSVTFPAGPPPCTAMISVSIVATRNGNSAFVTFTESTSFTPTNCAGMPNTCEVTETTMTRIGPEPSPCTSPVEASTWGGVKASYR
jgi:hypothetical protein